MAGNARPNILIVITHDSGRHFGCYGVPSVRTPNIDALASDGILFENMYATAPICSPARGSLLTGQYPQTNGLLGIAGGCWKWEMNDYRRHLSWVLREAGYRTVRIGLQHETEFIERLGFEDLTGYGVDDGRRGPSLLRGWPVGGRGCTALEVAERTARFLQQSRRESRPFFAQLGFFETHTPYAYAGCEPDESLGVWTPPYADRKGIPSWARDLNRFVSDPGFARRHLAALQGSLRRVDEAVGRLMQALRESGSEDNTLVLFTTDHGVELPGAKWTLYDPGLAVAFILRWPAGGLCDGRRCPWLLSTVDFLPTLLDILNLEPPHALEGRSYATVLGPCPATGPMSAPREEIHAVWVDGLNVMVRTDRFKLIRNGFPVPDASGRCAPPYELYDLMRDPLERRNVADHPDHAGIFQEMRARLDRWLDRVGDPLLTESFKATELSEAVAAYRRRFEAGRPRA